MVSALLAVAIALGVATAAPGAERPPVSFGNGLCAIRQGRCTQPVLAVFGAFPAELEPLVARATIHETLRIGDRVLRVGTLGKVPVVLGLLGIGLPNARDTARLVLDRFDVDGFVVSGVAGSPRRIADVTVPETWSGPDGVPHAADAAMLEIARGLTTAGVPLERCTPVPVNPPGATVCLAHEPAIVVGGAGETTNPYGERPPRCIPEGDAIFGCDVAAGVTARARDGRSGMPRQTGVPPVATDQETAAVAAEAVAAGVPYVAFRAVSDGAGDPLGLRPFPAQFFDYYQIAADNAAAAAAAFVERWGAALKARGAGRRTTPTVRASCAWERRASAACAGRHAPPSLRARVDRACRVMARDGADPTAAARAWQRATRLARTPAVRQRLGRRCGSELAEALAEPAAPPPP